MWHVSHYRPLTREFFPFPHNECWGCRGECGMVLEGPGAGLWGGRSWQALVLLLPPHCCVAAGKPLSFSGPQSPLPEGAGGGFPREKTVTQKDKEGTFSQTLPGGSRPLGSVVVQTRGSDRPPRATVSGQWAP